MGEACRAGSFRQDLEPLAMSAASPRASQARVGTRASEGWPPRFGTAGDERSEPPRFPRAGGPPGLGTAGDERSESPRFPRAGGHDHRAERDGGAPTTWTSDQTDMMRRVS